VDVGCCAEMALIKGLDRESTLLRRPQRRK